MAARDINRNDVLAAIKFRDDPGNSEFVRSLRFEDARKFRLVYSGQFYESKQIAGIAHGIATGQFWDRDDLSGGMRSGQAGGILSNLGFVIDDGPLYELQNLRVDRTHGRPAPYQYIVLLWAIARARSHSARLVPYLSVREELADALAPFAIRSTAPDPTMPWFALRRTSWWELQEPDLAGRITDGDVQSLNLVAGLSAALYERVRDDASFAGAAIDVIGRVIGEEPNYGDLLDNLGLSSFADETLWAPMSQADEPPSSDNRVLIVTWNPTRGRWRKVSYDEAISRTARGEAVVEDWSTGGTRNGIVRGVRAFMLQQGDQGRGLVASGTVLGEPYPIPHFDQENHAGEESLTVDIAWDHVFRIEDGIPTTDLKRELPKIYWAMPGSGVFIKGEAADRLQELWSDHLSALGFAGSPEVEDAIAAVESVSNPRRKFGRRFSPEENKAIEERAVAVTRKHFEDQLGYETKDVGATMSYDVHATKGQEVVKVEVKGTTTDGAAVVLTRNEVNLHRVEHPNNALAIVRNITLDRSGDPPVAGGGELVLDMPWEINESCLSPLAYDYRTGI